MFVSRLTTTLTSPVPTQELLLQTNLHPSRFPQHILPRQKRLHNADLLLQRRHPLGQLSPHALLIALIAQFGVEVLAIWGCGHGGAEDGLYDDAVVLFEGGRVGGAEGD